MTLPTNIDGVAEFASALITLDHLAAQGGDHVIQKMVYSTQYPEESLLALFEYYNEPHINDMESTREIISRGFNSNAVYVYVTRHGIVQMVMGTATLRLLIDRANFGEASMLTTVAALVGLVGSALETSKEKAGEYPPLTLLEFSLEAFQADANAQGEPELNAAAE